MLRGAKNLDPDALTAIYDCFSGSLYAYSMHMLGDPQLAEECVADTFSRFLDALHKGYGPKDYLKAYLYQVAHNWITDHFRQQPALTVELDEEVPSADQSNPQRSLDQSYQEEKMRSALLHLTADQRQVIVLRFLEGWDSAEVAAALNKPLGAVKALQLRALKSLKKNLSPDDIDRP
ncbi:MAG TPA: sigma-70 family RNA polymerase sigma factor [Anaerolineaceae bacterium]|nr:sigma-70 family RNA polymerase sigma factor [Anaerolineaceae bacterium]